MEDIPLFDLQQSVLIIDDVPSARLILADMLRELGFSECLEAKDGREALEVLRDHSVRLIFCDLMMEGMSGIDFLQALKDRRMAAVPPIIFVSSHGDLDSFDGALGLGASDYIVKPVSINKLRRKVESALKRDG
jgi:CheY-like chemotaxis protein